MLFHGQRTRQTKFEQEKLNGDATERNFCGLPEIAVGGDFRQKNDDIQWNGK